MYPMQFQPQYQPVQNNLLRVNGFNGAKAYQMQPNTTVALFDVEEDKFYVKTSDAGGFATIDTYSFHKEPNALEQDSNALKDELNELRAELKELKEAINGKQSIQKPKQ